VRLGKKEGRRRGRGGGGKGVGEEKDVP